MKARRRDLVNNDELAIRARQSHEASRRLPAEPKDAMLATPTTNPEDTHGSVEVRQLSSNAMSAVRFKLLKAAPVQSLDGEGPHEREARCVRSSQSRSSLTRFESEGSSCTSFLSGGVPFVDHLHQRLENMPDWRCLLPPVEQLREHRLPDVARPCSQREFTLGQTQEHHVQVALEFLKDNMKLTKSKFVICMLAADTEGIGVCQADFAQLKEHPHGTTHVLNVARSGESATSLPVLLMVGHVGWQVHVRLPTDNICGEDGREQLRIDPGELQELAIEFFKEIGVVTGVNIRSDLDEFFGVIHSLYGVDMWKHAATPVSLDWIACAAGYNMPRYSVEALNWMTFGTLLPKGMVSLGDRKWNHGWDNIPTPLRVYLAADISQVAGVGFVLECLWVLHVFPDVHAVTQISTLSPQGLLQWWHYMVVELILRILQHKSDVSLDPWDPKNSRSEMLEFIFAGSQWAEIMVQLTPKWPSLPAGGPRYNHSARAFLLDNLVLLNQMDDEVWPIMPPERCHLVVFDRHQVRGQSVPTDPVTELGWVPDPGVGEMITATPAEINDRLFKRLIGGGVGTKALLLEYVRFNPSKGRDLLIRL